MVTATAATVRAPGRRGRIRGPQGTITECFDRQAQRDPRGIAVRWRDRELSYAGLSSAASAMAARLAEHGIDAGARLGICLERTPEAIIAVLGALKAACTYVPLDPGHPRERLETMARKAGVSAVITDGACRERVGNVSGCVIMEVPAAALPPGGSRRAEPDHPPLGRTPARPSDPAYIVFTSGSSSGPKPVAVSHAQALGMYAAWEATYRLHDIATHLQMASIAFDVFTGDLLRALLSGATLVISPHETTLDPASLYSLLCSEQIECAEFVPAIFLPLVRYLTGNRCKLDFMKLIIVGSDRWTGRGYNAARAIAGPHTRVVNSYGVTEATIDSTVFLGADGLADDHTVPIGQPFPGVDVYVVDRDLQRVPPGTIGELAVGGVGVSYGYLRDPVMTAARFVPDPFGGRPGSRLYLTGDAARWTPGHGLELAGRLDEQVKINGVRIEPAEVEAVLASHHAVRDAAVVAARTGRGGREQLVGYVTPAAPAGVDSRAVRDHAARHLPPQAVPLVVVVDDLPKTANGKVDRRSLRQRDVAARAAPLARRHVTAPAADPVARKIAAIWCDVLGVSAVDAIDNFFEIGGQSILAAQVVAALRTSFGVPVPLWIMVETRSLGELADRVRRAVKLSRAAPRAPRVSPAVSKQLEAADVVVTGGTGATGSFVVRALARRGYSVAVVGREESAKAVPSARIAFIPADLHDDARLEDIARRATAIVHAACTFVTPDVDMAAMASLLRGWRRGPFVFVSSTDVYGAPHEGTVDESTSHGPMRTPYALAKQTCEALLRSAGALGADRSYTILRPAHVWGPHPRFRSQLQWGDLNWLVRPLADNAAVRVPGPTPAAAQRYGDAWIDVRDLATAVTRSLLESSNQVINAVGGHFSYYGLAHTLRGLLDSASQIELCDPAGCANATGWRYSAERLASALGLTPRRHYGQTLREVLSQPTASGDFARGSARTR